MYQYLTSSWVRHVECFDSGGKDARPIVYGGFVLLGDVYRCHGVNAKDLAPKKGYGDKAMTMVESKNFFGDSLWCDTETICPACETSLLVFFMIPSVHLCVSPTTFICRAGKTDVMVSRV